MYSRRENSCRYLKRREHSLHEKWMFLTSLCLVVLGRLLLLQSTEYTVTYLKIRRGQQMMNGLGDVSGVNVVVIWSVLVVVLEGNHEADQGPTWDLESPQEVAFLEKGQKHQPVSLGTLHTTHSLEYLP